MSCGFAGPGCEQPACLAFFQARRAGPFRWIINCAAYTAVDKAESEPQKARQINVIGAKNLAEIAAGLGEVFPDPFQHGLCVSQSSKHAVSGNGPGESKGAIVRTKLAGERAAFRANPQAMVIRTSWVYSAFGRSFCQPCCVLGNERDELRVVSDQIGSPTYAPDLADAVVGIPSSGIGSSAEDVHLQGFGIMQMKGWPAGSDFLQRLFLK